ncbi:hypothetical protein PoB_002783900 [Plakobranchus ocellatus]|uniref:Uncharacterized protein n=1 Tax=Plakobranchus ocellatus TaxID=259542 RepID=A0AAV4A527_9GAST|nr:hypothetical protein PoB_002783900 [Plakobranchus ocellatus]
MIVKTTLMMRERINDGDGDDNVDNDDDEDNTISDFQIISRPGRRARAQTLATAEMSLHIRGRMCYHCATNTTFYKEDDDYYDDDYIDDDPEKASAQQGDLRLSGPPPGQGTGGGLKSATEGSLQISGRIR